MKISTERMGGGAATARPIGVDLFSGVGGLSLGFEQAGFDVVAAVELDPVHAAVHEFNFPRCAVLPRSVAGLSGEAIRKAADIGRRSVDVVFGGAPCQGFSMMGQRALDDPRNLLVREFVRIVAELDATYFVFENVKGLTVGKHRRFLDEIIAAFTDRGYEVRLPWRVLNAAEFGVPQDRERVIIMGAKVGAPLPDYPMPFTRAAGRKSSAVGLPEGPTVRDAIGDLPDAEEYDALLYSDAVVPRRWGAASDYAAEMRCIDGLGWHFGHPREWNASVLTASMRTDHTEISRRRFAETPAGTVEPISRFFRLPSDGVSNTLRAGTDAARGAFTSPRPIHFALHRCITVREMARLHGFPDWFRFHATKWHGARQIGNAVPPPLGRAIAAAVMKASGKQPTTPAAALPLGAPHLVRMTLSEAAEYWGVPVAIGKRDRKSGATKRRQADIEATLAAAE